MSRKSRQRAKRKLQYELLRIIIGLSPILILLFWSDIKKLNVTIEQVAIAIVVTIIAIFLLAKVISIVKSKRYLASPLAKIDNMTGIEFEKYLKAVFENQGYKVELTPTTNDYGADLVCRRNGEITVVQAKRYSDNVGNSAVQEIVGAKGYYKANKCIVVTNSDFTKQAIKLAKSNDVELWNRDKLKKIIKDMNENYVVNV